MMTEDLWNSYADKVRNYFKKRIKDRDLALDLTQDTFQKVWVNRDQLEQIENHEAWIFRIARNTLYDYTRKIKEQSLGDYTIPEHFENSDELHSMVEDISNCLHQLIDEYEQERRNILRKIFTGSLSQKEVAYHMDIPYSTLKSRIQKARHEIRRQFERRCCKLHFNSDEQIIGCKPV